MIELTAFSLPLVVLVGTSVVSGAHGSVDDDTVSTSGAGHTGTAGPRAQGASGSGDIVLFGLIRLREPNGGDDGDAFASFVRFDDGLPGEALVAQFRPEPDTCTVETEDESDDDDDPFPNAPGRPFDFTGAGDALDIASPDGTFLTLQRFEHPGFEGYRPESRPLPTPFPDGLAVNVEGDDFPSFTDVPVVAVDTLEVSVPADDEGIASDTVFRWIAADAVGTRVEIELEFDDADDGDDIDVTCSAVDDGEFTLPQDVLDGLPAGAVADVEMTRLGFTVRRADDALLVVKSEAAGAL